MPAIQTTSSRRRTCCTGMVVSSRGGTPASTWTSGRSGSSQTQPEGSTWCDPRATTEGRLVVLHQNVAIATPWVLPQLTGTSLKTACGATDKNCDQSARPLCTSPMCFWLISTDTEDDMEIMEKRAAEEVFIHTPPPKLINAVRFHQSGADKFFKTSVWTRPIPLTLNHLF